MRVVLNINGPRGLTVDAQGRDPDGKFASGSGGGSGGSGEKPSGSAPKHESSSALKKAGFEHKNSVSAHGKTTHVYEHKKTGKELKILEGPNGAGSGMTWITSHAHGWSHGGLQEALGRGDLHVKKEPTRLNVQNPGSSVVRPHAHRPGVMAKDGKR